MKLPEDQPELNNRRPVRLVVIAASLGGTEAIREVLSGLPEDFPCVVIVQHMLKGFISMLCEDVAKKCRMKVQVASGGEKVAAGHAYFAGDGHQLLVGREGAELFLRAGSTEKMGGHCPSADALFHSAAQSAAPESVGVILTGMGADGAAGLLAMRQFGAYTIGQDPDSCAVYGMPRAAFLNGGVRRQLPLCQIAEELVRYVRWREG